MRSGQFEPAFQKRLGQVWLMGEPLPAVNSPPAVPGSEMFAFLSREFLGADPWGISNHQVESTAASEHIAKVTFVLKPGQFSVFV